MMNSVIITKTRVTRGLYSRLLTAKVLQRILHFSSTRFQHSFDNTIGSPLYSGLEVENLLQYFCSLL